MTASEYHKRAQECLDMAERFPSVIRAALLDIAKAWLMLADTALGPQASMEDKQNAPTTTKMQ